jgi:hypothetical protein
MQHSRFNVYSIKGTYADFANVDDNAEVYI